MYINFELAIIFEKTFSIKTQVFNNCMQKKAYKKHCLLMHWRVQWSEHIFAHLWVDEWKRWTASIDHWWPIEAKKRKSDHNCEFVCINSLPNELDVSINNYYKFRATCWLDGDVVVNPYWEVITQNQTSIFYICTFFKYMHKETHESSHDQTSG